MKNSFNDNDFHEFLNCKRKFIDFCINETVNETVANDIDKENIKEITNENTNENTNEINKESTKENIIESKQPIQNKFILACINLLFCAVENKNFGLEEEKLKLLINLIKKMNMKNNFTNETYNYLISKLASVIGQNSSPKLEQKSDGKEGFNNRKKSLYRKSFMVKSNKNLVNITLPAVSVLSEENLKILLQEVRRYYILYTLSFYSFY